MYTTVIHSINMNLIYTCASQNALVLLFGVAHFAKLQKTTVVKNKENLLFYFFVLFI